MRINDLIDQLLNVKSVPTPGKAWGLCWSWPDVEDEIREVFTWGE